MTHYSDLYTEAITADIIHTTSEGTYLGKYDRQKCNPDSEPEQQPIWTIRLMATPDQNTVKTLYPNGSKQYAFVWNNKENYNYKYAF